MKIIKTITKPFAALVVATGLLTASPASANDCTFVAGASVPSANATTLVNSLREQGATTIGNVVPALMNRLLTNAGDASSLPAGCNTLDSFIDAFYAVNPRFQPGMPLTELAVGYVNPVVQLPAPAPAPAAETPVPAAQPAAVPAAPAAVPPQESSAPAAEPAADPVTEERAEETRTELAAAQQEREELQAQLRTEQDRGSAANPAVIQQLAQQIAGTNGRISGLARELRALTGRVTAVEGRVTAVEGRVTTIEGQLSTFVTNDRLNAAVDAAVARAMQAQAPNVTVSAPPATADAEWTWMDMLPAWLVDWWKVIASTIVAIGVGVFAYTKRAWVAGLWARRPFQKNVPSEEDDVPVDDGNVEPLRTEELPGDSIDDLGEGEDDVLDLGRTGTDG